MNGHISTAGKALYAPGRRDWRKQTLDRINVHCQHAEEHGYLQQRDVKAVQAYILGIVNSAQLDLDALENIEVSAPRSCL